jgi:SAM-dependent methyltransferase
MELERAGPNNLQALDRLDLDLLDVRAIPADGLVDMIDDLPPRAGYVRAVRSGLARIASPLRGFFNRGAGKEQRAASGGTTAGSEPACPICDAPKSRFTAMNGRLCPDCTSLERQRILSLVFRGRAAGYIASGTGRTLLVSPYAAEKRIFRGVKHDKLVSVDVRPRARTDLVVDICNMPQVASHSFDCVFASYVMPCVHDLERALAEIKRVLKPGGVFVSAEVVRYGASTVEHSETSVIQGWYGQKNFEAYKVGSFRTLGRDDYEALLSRYFSVESAEATDPVTGARLPVFFCTSGARSPVLAPPEPAQ